MLLFMGIQNWRTFILSKHLSDRNKYITIAASMKTLGELSTLLSTTHILPVLTGLRFFLLLGRQLSFSIILPLIR